MTNKYPENLGRALRERYAELREERRSYTTLAAERERERAARRPSRATARVRKKIREASRDSDPATPKKPKRPKKVCGLQTRDVKAEVEQKVVEALLGSHEAIARYGLGVVLEKLRHIGLTSPVAGEAALIKAHLNETLDRYAARFAIQEKPASGAQNLSLWSEKRTRYEIARRIFVVTAGLKEMERSRSKSDALPSLCDGERGRLAFLDYVSGSHCMTSAKDFCRFLEMLRLGVAAPTDMNRGSAYCDGWRCELDRLCQKIKPRAAQ